MQVNKTQLAEKMGVSSPYINKLIKNGILDFKGKKTISFSYAKKMIEDNSDPKKDYMKRVNQRQRKKKDPVFEDVNVVMKEQEVIEDIITEKSDIESVCSINVFTMNDEEFTEFLNNLPFAEARSWGEKMSVFNKRIQIKRTLEELVLKEDVQRNGEKLGRVVVSNLTNLPERLADTLAGISDAIEVRRILVSEVNAIINNLKKELSE